MLEKVKTQVTNAVKNLKRLLYSGDKGRKRRQEIRIAKKEAEKSKETDSLLYSPIKNRGIYSGGCLEHARSVRYKDINVFRAPQTGLQNKNLTLQSPRMSGFSKAQEN